MDFVPSGCGSQLFEGRGKVKFIDNVPIDVSKSLIERIELLSLTAKVILRPAQMHRLVQLRATWLCFPCPERRPEEPLGMLVGMRYEAYSS